MLKKCTLLLFGLSLFLSTSALPQDSPITKKPPFPFVVDGLALEARVRFDSKAYSQYQCVPSEYPGLTWCHKAKTEKTKRGEVTLANSILHRPDGTTVYVNHYEEPTFFSSTEVRREIDRLSGKFGRPAGEFRIPPREGLPDAIIAIWGQLKLEPIDQADTAIVASGGSLHKGILVSLLGDLQRSAKRGVPVYRITKGPGFLWSVTFNKKKRGVLRFLAIDASQIETVPTADNSANQPVPDAIHPDARPFNGVCRGFPEGEWVGLLVEPEDKITEINPGEGGVYCRLIRGSPAEAKVRSVCSSAFPCQIEASLRAHSADSGEADVVEAYSVKSWESWKGTCYGQVGPSEDGEHSMGVLRFEKSTSNIPVRCSFFADSVSKKILSECPEQSVCEVKGRFEKRPEIPRSIQEGSVAVIGYVDSVHMNVPRQHQ
jgi:hypothetical protein